MPGQQLDSEEAARRLGVKVSTLYAYVSRGLLTPERAPGSRRSLFALEDVERLAGRSRSARPVEGRLASVVTAVTHLGPEGPAYRGVPATSLAGTTPYEEVAELLWASGPVRWDPAPLDHPPPELPAGDVMFWAAVMAGAADPVRSDLRPEAVARAAARLIATVVEALPGPEPGRAPDPVGAPGGPVTIARRVASKLSADPTPVLVDVVNAALVILADHELATSTVAVRVAASTRADLYDAVLAGLATMAGPLHGGASPLAHQFLVRAATDGVERAVDEALRWQGHLPGFGHAVYRDGDPRAPVLLECFERLADDHQRRLVDRLLEMARAHELPLPNVDLALAALTYAGGLAPDAGRTLFALARMAGWAAHYMEELGERPLRFRVRAVYSGEPTAPRRR